MTRTDAQTSQSILSDLQRLVEDQVIFVKRRPYKARLFAVPVTLTSKQEFGEGDCSLADPAKLIESFHQSGLLRREDGVVLMKKLVLHEQLSATSYSNLFALAKQLTSNLVAHGVTGVCDFESGDFPQCLQTNYDFVSVRYVIGVCFWDSALQEPPLWTEVPGQMHQAWARRFKGMIELELLAHQRSQIFAEVSEPRGIYAAVDFGTAKTIRSVVGTYVRALCDDGEAPQVILSVNADIRMPSGCQISVEIFNRPKQSYWTFSMNVRSPNLKRIQDTYEELGRALEDAGAAVTAHSFASALSCGQYSIYCH